MNFLFPVAFVLGCVAFVFNSAPMAIAGIAVAVLGEFGRRV
jgi:hypothetical protein